MCLAIPGKVKEVDGRQVMIEYPGETRKAFLGDEKLEPGDYVSVQMGVVVRKLTKEAAEDALAAWNEVS